MIAGFPLIRVLGPVGLGSRFLTRQEQLVLAVLAARRGQAVTVERLVDALWPEGPPGTARNRIQSTISSLRRGAPPAPIDTSHGGYLLRADESNLDALRFERGLRLARQRREAGDPQGALSALDTALEMWRGSAFEGIAVPAVTGEAARLTELRHETIEELFELTLIAGRGVAVADLAAHVQAAPLRQRLRGLLMTALYRGGRQAEALQVYRAGAQLLAAEHGLDPAPELRRLYESILREDRPPLPGSGDVPRQLPASPADFTGRHSELSHLRKLVAQTAGGAGRPGTALLIGISGMAGVGKTTLAVRAAHDLQPYFPGGCLYANLHGNDSPTLPAHVLGAFLRACGVTGPALPSSLEERAALYRTLLAEREVLVVLDNAAGEDQVAPLMPGAGATMLLTSRRPLTGLPGIRLLRLEVLQPADAVDLLAAVVGRDRVAAQPVAAQHVAHLCGGLPLALRVVAVRLAANDKLDLAMLGTRLADERQRLDELALPGQVGEVDVRASLGVSRRRLTPVQDLHWQALCALPFEEIPFPLIPTMLEMPQGGAHRFMEELAGSQLVHEVNPGRYQVHDLIRLFGRELAQQRSDGQIAALTARACRELWRQAHAANASLPCRPIPSSLTVAPPDVAAQDGEMPDAAEFLERELANIMSAIRFALSTDDVELAAGLSACLTNFCLMRGLTDQWAQSHDLVLAHHRPPSPRALAAVQLGAATLHRFADRNRAALPYLRRALLIYRREGDAVGEAVCLLSWSIAVRTLGHTGIGACATSAATEMLGLLGKEPVQLGFALLTQHHLRPDPGLLRQALAIFEEGGEDWGAAEVHSMLSDWHLKAGEVDIAERHVLLAMRLYAGFGDRVNHLITRLQLAQVHLARGNRQAAATVLHAVLPLAQRMRHPWCLATAHRLLGELNLDQDEAAQAVWHLEQAAQILRTANHPLGLALALQPLAMAQARLGERETALASGGEAHALLTQLRPPAAGKLGIWLDRLRGAPQPDHSAPTVP